MIMLTLIRTISMPVAMKRHGGPFARRSLVGSSGRFAPQVVSSRQALGAEEATMRGSAALVVTWILTWTGRSGSGRCSMGHARVGVRRERPPGVRALLACLEEYVISLLDPFSGSRPWNPLAVATSACLRKKKTKQTKDFPESGRGRHPVQASPGELSRPPKMDKRRRPAPNSKARFRV